MLDEGRGSGGEEHHHPLTSTPTQATPSTFWEVIRGWGNTWMWDNLAITGNLDLIAASIADNSCVAVTDGLYMKDLYPYLNSAAFVLECSKGRGRLMGSFVENTPNAGSYHGELLGLMAIHHILQSLNEVSTDLWGLGQMDYHAKSQFGNQILIPRPLLADSLWNPYVYSSGEIN